MKVKVRIISMLYVGYEEKTKLLKSIKGIKFIGVFSMFSSTQNESTLYFIIFSNIYFSKGVHVSKIT